VVCGALRHCIAAAVAATGARAQADASLKAALAAQLQRRGNAAKVLPPHIVPIVLHTDAAQSGRTCGDDGAIGAETPASTFCKETINSVRSAQTRKRQEQAVEEDVKDVNVDAMEEEMHIRQQALAALRGDA